MIPEDLLQISKGQLREAIASAPVELHPVAIEIKGNLSLKKSADLIAYFIGIGHFGPIQSAYEELRNKDVRALVELSKSETTPVATLIVALALAYAFQSGKPLELVFPRGIRAAKIDDPNIRYREWLCEQFAGLTDEVILLSPSEWAEEYRYLPPEVTPMPGPFSFDICPYWKEPLDCLSPEHPCREMDIMKGVQVCFTVAVLENYIGYAVAHIKNAPVMLLTADAGLAKIRVDNYITPMLQHSELEHLIQSNDMNNKRKTGKTKDQIQWQGGGFLITLGAQNADKLRSISIQILLEDEVDGYPHKVGKDGKPGKLAEDRTAAYESSAKILRGSTPLQTQTSVIHPEYQRGDKRKYLVPCKHCGKRQELVWTGTNEDGSKYGMKFDVDEDGVLVYESVRYVCMYCAGEHTNDDKAYMLPRGKWVPTKKPDTPHRRSYHISSLYSPPGFRSWETWATRWCECWDVKRNKVKDVDLLQQFYNNGLGRPFQVRGESLRLETVVLHRRPQYASGTVPNALALEETGSIVHLLVATVDVHKRHLDVQVVGFCKGKTFYSVDYFKIEGEDCRDESDSAWDELAESIESKEYKSDCGRLVYRPYLTLVDVQYAANAALAFCARYSAGVFPISGRDTPPKNAVIREFQEYTSKLGTIALNITTTIYKDRLASALRREWDGLSRRAHGSPNFPIDFPESFFKELTAEKKVEKINKTTGQSMGFYWHRPGGADNHSWDLTVYAMAALDVICYDKCINVLGLEEADWPGFWQLAETAYFYADLDAE